MASEAEKRRAAMAQLGKAWGIALEFIVSILVFTAIGWVLDWWLGTEPWFILAGMGFGFIGGVYRLLRAAQSLGLSSKQQNDSSGEGS